MLELHDIEFKYPEFTLGPLNWSLPRGVRCALVGRNGAGKSTLLALLAGQLMPDRGRLSLFGADRLGVDVDVRQRVALVSLDAIGCPWMTVAEHLGFVGNFYRNWNESQARELARALSLPLEAKLSGLSRGTALKVALCTAWGQSAELLLLDEPTAGLDPVARHELLRQLDAHLSTHEELSVIIATHILEDLDAMHADQLFALRDGRGHAISVSRGTGDARLSDVAREILLDAA